jgi:hypothetical protein
VALAAIVGRWRTADEAEERKIRKRREKEMKKIEVRQMVR